MRCAKRKLYQPIWFTMAQCVDFLHVRNPSSLQIRLTAEEPVVYRLR
jgi:hypothetical protein